MKQNLLLLLLACAVGWCGCAHVHHQAAGTGAAGALAIRLTTLHGMEGSYRDARLYVDGRFVGNYEPDETVLALTPGRHVVKLEVPRVYSRQSLPDGSAVIRPFILTGEERLEVLGGRSQQSLVFNSENLNFKEIADDEGR